MTLFLTGLLFASMIGVAIGVYFLLRIKKSSQDPASVSILLELQRTVQALKSDFQSQSLELTRQVSNQLQEHSKSVQQSQEGFHKTVSQVQDRLGQLQQATQNMVDIGKDIASLQNILKAPKLRGGLGELLLSELLKQILPEDHFSLQYSFQTGCTVDAVIILGQGMIPVDAKFPLENFQKILTASNDSDLKSAKKAFASDVKKHIDQIADKYILPAEGTFDFALMYIPAENIYYETIIKDDIHTQSIASYAIERKIIPVSPNSFYAYLQAIVRGLRGLRIERSAQVILESLNQLQGDFQRCFADFEKTGTHINNAQSAYQKAMKRFERLQDKLTVIDESKNMTSVPKLDMSAASDDPQ